jgi:hypothetical protein
MADGEWHTLKELSTITGASEASCSARLRDFRKPKFGGHTVDRRRVLNGNGLHIYRIPRPLKVQPTLTLESNVQDIEVRVAQYVKLRDMIKEKDDAHKKTMEKPKLVLEQLNSLLLDHLNQIGGNSVATNSGTVYRTEKKSAPLADPQAFLDFVIANNAYDLLDRKANVTAVTEFIKENNAPPPGVNFSSTFVVGVRRANGGKE